MPKLPKMQPIWVAALSMGFWAANVFVALNNVVPWNTALVLALAVFGAGVWIYALWAQQQLIIQQNKLIAAKLEYIKNRMDIEVMEAARFLITNTKVG